MGVEAGGTDIGQEGWFDEDRGKEEVAGKEGFCEEEDGRAQAGKEDPEEVIGMAGAIVLVLVLLAFPIVVGLSTAALAGVIGHFLWKDAETRHEGSELLDTNI